MEQLSEAAPAKLNLSLRVGARRDDGYHPLAGVMVTLSGLSDLVTVRRSERRRVDCGIASGPQNLAWRALEVLDDEMGWRLPPLHVSIDKRIPSEAGLGGGSSDAAATLRIANRLLDLRLDDARLERVGARVGSDVPFFVRGGAQWVTGRGDHLVPIETPGRLWVLVVPPVRGLSTADVYRCFDTLGASAELPATPPSTPWWAGDWVGNDLWEAAATLAPELRLRAADLAGLEPVHVLLCGSGGCLAALYDDPDRRNRAADRLGTGWRCEPAPATPPGG